MPLPQNTFAPKNKTKGLFDKTKALMSKRKPEQSFCYAPTEESGCIFRIRFFNRIPGGNRWWRYRTELMQIPGCICRFALGFCKNIKKRTETLYQSFSPFMSYPTLVSIITLSPCAPRNFAFHSIQLLKSCNNGHPQEQKSRQIAGKMWFKTSYSAMKPFAFSAAISAS